MLAFTQSRAWRHIGLFQRDSQ